MSTITHTAASLDVTVGLDDSLTLNVTVEDGDGNTIDVSAWTLEGDHCTPSIVDGPAGRIDLAMYSSTVGTWAWGLRRSSSPAKRLLAGDLRVTETGSADTSSSLTLQVTDDQVSVTINETVSAGEYASALPQSGYWLSSVPVNRANLSVTNEALRATPLLISGNQSLTRLSVYVQTAGEANSVVRLGLYDDDGSGQPGALILDAGTVAADTTGAKRVAISQSVANRWVWPAAVVQGAPTTAPQLSCLNIQPIGMGASSDTSRTNSTRDMSWEQTAVSGALPDPFAPTGTQLNPPIVMVEVAA